MSQTVELLDRLIAFPTVSRDPNRTLIDFVAAYLAERGVESELIETPDGSKTNLFATIGPEDLPGVILSGHTDVVPVDGQSWLSDPFAMRVRDGRAFGRGTADMKGFLAAALALVDRAIAAPLKAPIHLALSYDEEIGCVGVRSLIEHLAGRFVRPRFCLIGEPTSMRVALGHKGKLAARVCAHGATGHSALAPKALNAIHLACDFVDRLRFRQGELASGGHMDGDYDIPFTTIHVGTIAGGSALNIVPENCTLDFEIRNIAGDDAAELLALLRRDADAIVKREKARFECAAIEIETVNAYPALDTPPDAEIVAFAKTLVEDDTHFKVAFGTEGGLFHRDLSVPTIVCGPGSMEQGHKADEFVELDQLSAADRMMDRLLQRLCT